MSARQVLSFGLMLSMASAPARAAVTLWTEVPVRVYDTTGTSPPDRQRSLDVASSIVSEVAVHVVWRVCDPQVKGQRSKGKGEVQGVGVGVGVGVGTGGCDSPMGPRELALRIVRSPVPSLVRSELPLGDAFVDTQVGRGVLATVYLDRVEWMARQTRTDRSVLLGRAIAHELGHLLMATSAHGPAGLMRAVWSRDELRRSRTSDWAFGQAEIAAIRARVLGR